MSKKKTVTKAKPGAHRHTAFAHDGSQVQVSVPADETAPAPAATVGHDGGPSGEPAAVPAAEAKTNARRPRGAKANKGEQAEAEKADQAKQQRDAKPKRVSALDAAATVLTAAAVPMRASDLIAEMLLQGLWSSPAGKTPEATLYAAIIREIKVKGPASRFAKHAKGLFVATGKGA